jgi:Lrp/AsnC family transcriptional regulator for asnA, asnC and gidA
MVPSGIRGRPVDITTPSLGYKPAVILSPGGRSHKGSGGNETHSQRNPRRTCPLTTPGSHAALDEVSKAIIAQLQQDGRRSYAAIGKVVGLSEAAVRQRVQRLVEHGAMQIVAVTDPMELGFARQAMVGVRVSGPVPPVADKIAELEEVDYVVVTAGSFDILVELVAESDEHLLDIVSNGIRTVDGVETTETFMYLGLRKQTYSWGVR